MSPAPQPARRPVDLESPAARKSLARQVTKLLGLWQLSATEQAAMLGLSQNNRSTLARYRKGDPLAPNRDLLARVGHLLGIHKSLRILFPHNRDLAYAWIGMHNQRFGARPVDIVSENGFEGLLAIRRYLDFERGR